MKTDKREEIAMDAVGELVMLALGELEQNDAEIKKASAELSDLAERIANDESLDKNARQRMLEYTEKFIGLSAKHYSHLYIQGATDMIPLLKKLGAL